MARHRADDKPVPESLSNIVIDEFLRPPPCLIMLKTTLSLACLFLNFVSIISWFTQDWLKRKYNIRLPQHKVIDCIAHVSSHFQRFETFAPNLSGIPTVYPKKYAHGFCFAVLCCGSTLTDFPISTRLTSLALWQSNDCPSASKATLMNMDKYFIWIHYERITTTKQSTTKPCAYFLGYTVNDTGTITLFFVVTPPTPMKQHRRTLRWRQNGRDSVSNHQPHDCLLNCLFRRRSKKTSKLRVTGLCVGNSPGTGEFPAQMVSNAENVSIWWRHHDIGKLVTLIVHEECCTRNRY